MYDTAQTQGRNIRHYCNYLTERVRAYRDTKTDWVRAPESRLEKLTVEKGLLRETEVVQHQLTALLKCDVRLNLGGGGGDACDCLDTNNAAHSFWIKSRKPRLLLPRSDFLF